MIERIDRIIAMYENRREVLQGDIDEIEELLGDEFDISDVSGGNIDDAYEIGREHGEVPMEFGMLGDAVADLRYLKEYSKGGRIDDEY